MLAAIDEANRVIQSTDFVSFTVCLPSYSTFSKVE